MKRFCIVGFIFVLSFVITAQSGNGASNFRAFPYHNDGIWTNKGMTMLDYFAGQAMTCFLQSNPGTDWTASEVARRAYQYGQAMLIERGKYIRNDE